MATRVKQPSLDETLKEMGVSLEQFASDVQKISRAIDVIYESRLKWSTIILLVSRASGVGQREVQNVLEALPDLGKKYLKPEGK